MWLCQIAIELILPMSAWHSMAPSNNYERCPGWQRRGEEEIEEESDGEGALIPPLWQMGPWRLIFLE